MSENRLPTRRTPTPFGMREHRVGDAERSACAEQLGEHFAAGRLSHDDYESRVHAAMVAQTTRDLAALTADLPPLGAVPTAPPWWRLLLEGIVALGSFAMATLLGVLGIGMVIADAPNWPWMLLFSLLVGAISVTAALLAVRDARMIRTSAKWMRKR